MSQRKSSRSRRAPTRLELSNDDTALQQALRRSLVEKARTVIEVPEAPVFRPTAKEFEDPFAYIASIQTQAAAAGIAKIVPPAGWRNDGFDLNVKQFFKTKRQQVHALQEGLPFGEGTQYNQLNYKLYADNFYDNWMDKHSDVKNELLGASEEAQIKLLEEQYWKIVDCVSGDKVVVDYANDIDTQIHGTAFGAWAGKWDMSKLVNASKSVLRELGFAVEGLTHPWLYFGALFATFCWHTEDHFLYSLNYLHEGSSKTWYGVAGKHARRFEDVMRTNAPERFSEDRDLLHHLITQLSPSLLASQGVHVCHTIQRAGEFVVTFPKAYHSGFSHGWNCSEAVNFATTDWLPFGLEAVQRYCKGPGKRPAVFSHDKLVWELAEDVLEADRVQKGGAARLLVCPSSLPRAPEKPAALGPVNVNAAAVANLGLPLSLPKAPLLQPQTASLPKPLPSPGLLGSRYVSFTQRQVAQISDALTAVATAELKSRMDVRFEGVKDRSLVGIHAADGELASCDECGALPYFSCVRCDCRPTQLRCLAHAHIGCTCDWSHKGLLVRLSDVQLAAARQYLQELAAQSHQIRANLLCRYSSETRLASFARPEEAKQRPSVQQPAGIAPARQHVQPTQAPSPQQRPQIDAVKRERSTSPAASPKVSAPAQRVIKPAFVATTSAGKPGVRASVPAVPVSQAAMRANSAAAKLLARPLAEAIKRPVPEQPQRLSGSAKRARMRAAAHAAQSVSQSPQPSTPSATPSPTPGEPQAAGIQAPGRTGNGTLPCGQQVMHQAASGVAAAAAAISPAAAVASVQMAEPLSHGPTITSGPPIST